MAKNGSRPALAGPKRVGRSGVPTQNLLRFAARGGSVGQVCRVGNTKFHYRGSVGRYAEWTFNFPPPLTISASTVLQREERHDLEDGAC